MVVADVRLVHELGKSGNPDVVGGRLRDRLAVEYPVDPIARQMLGRPEPGHLLGEVGDEGVGITVGGDRNRQRSSTTECAPRRPPQPTEDAAGDVQHDLRRRCDEFLEHLRRERRQCRVAHRPNRCRPGCTIEQTQFAHHLTAAELGDQAFTPVSVVDEDRHPTSDDEVGSVRDVALVEERVAGFESTPRHPVDDLLHEVVVAVAHQVGHHGGHVRAIDTLASLIRHAVGDLRVAVQPGLELRPLDLEHLDRPTGGQLGRSQATGDHCHLTDHLPFADGTDHHFALGSCLRGSDRARLDEVDVVCGVALLDQHITLDQRDRASP